MALKKDPAILLYKDKWINATQGMSGNSKGWYLDLIIYQFDHGDLPNDMDELAAIARIKPSEWEQFKQVFEQVFKQRFKQNDNGRLENDTAKEILTARELFKKKRSEAGKLSYVLKYFRKNFKIKRGMEEFLKQNIDLDFDIKNEQVLKQVFEQISELYINANVIVNSNIEKKEGVIKNLFESSIPSPDQNQVHWIQKFILENCPTVLKMKTQLTRINCEILEKAFTRETIERVLEAMENWKDILQKTSVFLTTKNWCSRDFGAPAKEGKHEFTKPKQFHKKTAEL